MKLINDIDLFLIEKKKFLDDLFEIELEDIYVMELSKNDFEIMKQPKWVVGFSYPRKRIIFVMNKEQYERTYEEWLKLIVHEMVHIYYLTVFETAKPGWLFEGLASYIAEQKQQKVEVSINDLIKNFNKPEYVKGYNFVRKMLEK